MPEQGFQGSRLTQARKIRLMTQKALSQLIGKSSQAISQFESGTATPSADVVKELAKVLQVPIELLYKPGKKQESAEPVFYRSMSAATKKARSAAEIKLEWIDDCVTYFEDMLELPVFDAPQLQIPSDPLLISSDLIEDAANRLRLAWDVPNGPIENMIGLLERHGIFVFMMPLGADTLDALSTARNKLHPFIIVGTDQGNACRWRFDCAHELGHLILHRGIPECDLTDPPISKLIENQAHRFASAFLLPEKEFVESLFTVRLDGYRELKPYWRVSISAMIRRTKDLDLISEEDYRNLCISMSRRKWRRNEPFDNEMIAERPALANKCLAFLSDSIYGAEDDFLRSVSLPEDFIMTIFDRHRRNSYAHKAQVVDFSNHIRKDGQPN